MPEPLMWVSFNGGKYTVIGNWSVLPFIDHRVSYTTQDIWIPDCMYPDQRSVFETWIELDKSIQLTGLQRIHYEFHT